MRKAGRYQRKQVIEHILNNDSENALSLFDRGFNSNSITLVDCVQIINGVLHSNMNPNHMSNENKNNILKCTMHIYDRCISDSVSVNESEMNKLLSDVLYVCIKMKEPKEGIYKIWKDVKSMILKYEMTI